MISLPNRVMKTFNRSFVKFVSFILPLAVTFVAMPAMAEYPDKLVKIVHPYPGASVDAAIRLIAEKLSQKWKQPVIIEPRPGASEILAGDYVAKAKPDGYTLLMSSDSNFSLNQFLYTNLPFKPERDLIPVTELFEYPLYLVVSKQSGIRSLDELIDTAKKRQLAYGTSGQGAFNHLGLEAISRSLKITMLHVPYKPGGGMIQDLVAGRIDVILSGNTIVPFQLDDRVTALAVSGATRQKALPLVPTFSETGYPELAPKTYFGLAVPKGTQAPVIEKIAADIREILMSVEYQQRAQDTFGFDVVGSTPKQFSEALQEKRKRTQELIQAIGLKLN